MRTPRARRPVWNNPRRQLPGTGIRREVLLSLVIIWRTMFQDSGSESDVCAGEERPSLFSDSGNSFSSFNPFAAALSSLSPAERYEAEFIGASEFLTRRVNAELQRAFEAGIPASQVYHIGTPR